MTERPELLQQREKTHGSFVRNAQIAQSLKGYYRARDFDAMREVHREALDMIAVKISRILSGQANFKDHWDDIAGYAQLAAEACQES